MNLVIVTGLSGAGKSQAVKALEDLGYYCVDNMPAELVSRFAELLSKPNDRFDKAALVCDIRSGTSFDELFEQLDTFESQGNTYEILFLDANNYNLIRRYKETRRKHPLLDDSSTLGEAISTERKLLMPVKERANHIINTSYKPPSQTIKEIKELFSSGTVDTGMTITILSFGFKHGLPHDCDMMFDVRFLPNPYYIAALAPHTGLDKTVSDYVLGFEDSQVFLKMLKGMIDYLIPRFASEGRAQVVIAIGCTGGKHRSVTLAEEVCSHLDDLGHQVKSIHRDMNK